MQYVVESMRISDIAAVGAIERLSFPQPWPQSAYRREILENRMAYYVVARAVDEHAPPPARTGDIPPPPLPDSGEGGVLGRLQRLFRSQDELAAPPSRDRGIIGYAGLWLMSDEAHVTTIAVHPDQRGKRVGELLLVHLIDRSLTIGARWVTLEVRVTNRVAQALYRKYTFKEMGVRRRYYSDNGEDALIMWTDALDSERFKEVLESNRANLWQRLAGTG